MPENLPDRAMVRVTDRVRVMAINPSTNTTMTGRITAADSNYPYGSSKNETAVGAKDGTPYFKQRADDLFGLQQALLVAAGITPSGDADTAIASQYLQAMVELISGRASTYDDSGAADAYIFDLRTGQQAPAAYFDGMTATAPSASASCTGGACTVNVAGLGSVSIKLRGGVLDPLGGDIVAGDEIRLIYRTSPSAHFELQRGGRVRITYLTASDAAWAPQPDTFTIQFVVTGGGGGGGGVDGQGAGTSAAGSAGAGAGTALFRAQGAAILSSYDITVGAGGTGGAAGANPGTSGGDSIVAGYASPITGEGGAFGSGQTAGSALSYQGNTGAGSGVNGQININGGQAPTAVREGETVYSLNQGGGSYYGPGACGFINSIGGAANVPGAGGAGGCVSGVLTDYAGGDGGDGLVVITEWLS